MSAPCQAGESVKDFDHHMQVTQQIVQTECLVPPSVEVQSSLVDIQSMHANPAFMQQEVRGHSMQVGIVAPPADRYIPQSEPWVDRVAHQKMRMEDLSIRGISHIEDQAITFYNRQVIDR